MGSSSACVADRVHLDQRWTLCPGRGDRAVKWATGAFFLEKIVRRPPFALRRSGELLLRPALAEGADIEFQKLSDANA